jgi:hypothetical protein
VGFEVFDRIADALVEVGISTLDGTRIVSAFTIDGNRPPLLLPPGRHRLQVDIETVLLPRIYTVDAGIHHSLDGQTIDMVERVLDFTVLNVAEQGADAHFPAISRGFVRPDSKWSFGESIVRHIAR